MNFFKKLFLPQKENIAVHANLAKLIIEVPIKAENPPASVSPIVPQEKILSEEEITAMINDIALDNFNSQNEDYLDGLSFDINNKDALFEDAARLVVSSQSGSTALLQRRMKLGYNRAGRLMDQLEAAGIVGPNQGAKLRDVLIQTDTDLQMFLNHFDTYTPNKSEFIKSFYEQHKDRIDKRVIKLEQQQILEKETREKELIKQKLLEKEKKARLQKEARDELKSAGLINNTADSRRQPIPQNVMDAVWNRDGGRCIKCSGQEGLEFDHIIPFSRGGADTYRNLQILCRTCNAQKSNSIG